MWRPPHFLGNDGNQKEIDVKFLFGFFSIYVRGHPRFSKSQTKFYLGKME